LHRLHADLPPVPLAGRVDAGAVAIPLVAAVCFILVQYEGSVGAWPAAAGHFPPAGRLAPIAAHLYWFGASLLFYGVVPLAALVLLREPLGEYGLGPGRWRLGLSVAVFFIAVMLPVVLAVSRSAAFASHYPLARPAGQSLGLFVPFELGYAAYFVAWEHVFRSFLLFGLYRRVGLHAVYLQTLPFVLLHFGKPELEALASVLAGVGLGYLALHARSFWWGTLVHTAVALAMDLATSWRSLAGV